MKQKRMIPCLILAFALCGCSQTPPAETTLPQVTQDTSESISYDALPLADMFSQRDSETEYDPAECTLVTLSGDSATASGSGVQISGSTVTVTQEGSYLIRGVLDDGYLTVDADKTHKIQLILDGVTIHSEASAAIYIRQADKVFITLPEGSQNTLSSGEGFTPIDENNIDSVIFSKDDLTLNGSGSLHISSPAGHGIVSKDDLRITGGSYQISANSHGMTANDSVRICGGSFRLETGKDGIQADNSEDSSLGFVYISGGSFTVNAAGDGISAGATMQIDGGEFLITCGGGSQYGEEHTDDMFGGGHGGPGGPGGMGGFWGSSSTSETQTDSVSTKGLKSTGPMILNGGNFTLNTADDAVHSNNTLTVNGGSYTVATGDDGFHADEALTVEDGSIAISESYEGLEGLCITVNGGTIRLKASDDGLNAAGGNDQSGFGGMGGRPGKGGFDGDMFGNSSDSFIIISGGNLFVDADGDGIDSNDNLTFTGGYTVVEGPTNGGNAPLDYGGSGSLSGGTIYITGSAGMAQSLQATGTQGILAVTVGSCSAGTQVCVTDQNGQVIASVQPEKLFGCVIISCPEMQKGETYQISVGSETGSFEA